MAAAGTEIGKVVVVTRKTMLEELVERHGTRGQARFIAESRGGTLHDVEAAHDTYHAAAATLSAALPPGTRVQWIDRGFLPTFLFSPRDLVVTLGQDGLVVNAAKYLDGQPVLAFNPDPARIDGVLVPFGMDSAAETLLEALAGRLERRRVTMARATLDDGQTIEAVNDLFIGVRSHASARYRIEHGGRSEGQSSSGVIVSTGAGSTGWYRSVLSGAAGVATALGDAGAAAIRDRFRFDMTARELRFSVREPFTSRTSGAEIVCGRVTDGDPLRIVSQMPRGGTIFSDGMEEDFLPFDAGLCATIGISNRALELCWPDPAVSDRRSRPRRGAGPPPR